MTQPTGKRFDEIESRFKDMEKFHKQTVASLEATIDGLKQANTRVSNTNDVVQSKLDSEWDQPKRWFWGVTAIAAVIFGVNLLTQTITSLGITKLHAQLTSEIKDSADTRDEITQATAVYRSHLRAVFGDN